MDNIVDFTYFKKIVGKNNQKTTILSKEILENLISKQIMITAEYILGSLKKVVDL